MNGPSALISVVIPVRDGAAFLAEAIESVLAQDYRPLEVIVIDDGSQDDTRRVADRYAPEVRVEWQPPAGLGAALNHGVEIATADLLSFLDSDDHYEPGRLRLVSSALVADPALEAVFGHVAEFVDPGVSAAAGAKLRRPNPPVPSHLITAMLIRRAALDRVGLFATDITLGTSLDWYARALEAGLRSVMLPEVVHRRRLHGGNMSVTVWDAGQDYVRVVRAALDRRRAGKRS